MSYLGANVFVTGASRGIGLGLVKELLKRPEVKLIFAGARKPEEAADLKAIAAANPNVRIVQFDSLCDKSIHAAVESVKSVVGSNGLQLLINNAGVFLSDGNNSANPERDAILKVFNTNVAGIMISVPAFTPLLEAGSTADRPAKVLNISSTAGSITKLDGTGFPHSNATYPASKAALNSYTKFMSAAPHTAAFVHIAMCPGWVRTDMGGQRAALGVDESTEAIISTIAKLGKADSGRFVNRNGETVDF